MPINQFRVVMELAPALREDPEVVGRLRVAAAAADPAQARTLVPMSAFSSMRQRPALGLVSHSGAIPSETLSFNLAPGHSLGEATAAIEAALAGLGLPAGMTATFSGSAQAFQESLASMPWLVVLAVVAMYLVLGMLYESLLHPLTILSTLPSAGVGALGALLATGSELSVIAVIGIVLLIGIVKKNAIMLVDFALDQERRLGLSAQEAMTRACLIRLRPIVMTTAAAILGALPLLVGHGYGSEFRRPLGISIIGGLLASQLLTVYTTPAVYIALSRLRDASRRAPSSTPTPKEPVP